NTVNKVASMLYNEHALPIGMTPISPPEHYDAQFVPGVGLVNRNTVTNKTDVSDQPGYSIEKGQDIYGRAFGMPVQTTGFGAGGGGRASGSASAPAAGNGAGMPAGAIPLGVEKPTEAEEKSATFAKISGTVLPKMEAMENQNVFLSPKVRT